MYRVLFITSEPMSKYLKYFFSILVLFAVALIPASGAMAQTQTPLQPIKPVLESVIACTNTDGYRAVWGYYNQNDFGVEIPYGVTPGVSRNTFNVFDNMSQPTVFEPGRKVAVFSTSILPTENQLWTLGLNQSGIRTATASGSRAIARECY